MEKQVLLEALPFQFNCGIYSSVQVSSSKLPKTPHAYRPVEQTFGAEITTSKKFQSHIWLKTIGKISYIIIPSASINCGTYPIVQSSPVKLPLTSHAYRLLEQTFDTKVVLLRISNFSCTVLKKKLKKYWCTVPSVSFNCRTLKNAHISYSKLPMTLYLCSLVLTPN